MRPKTSVNPLATRKYSAARVSPFIPVVRNSFGLSASPHTTNAAAGTPTTSPQNHRQKSDTRRSGYRAAPACLRGPDFGLLVEHAVLHHRELDQDLAGVRLGTGTVEEPDVGEEHARRHHSLSLADPDPLHAPGIE